LHDFKPCTAISLKVKGKVPEPHNGATKQRGVDMLSAPDKLGATHKRWNHQVKHASAMVHSVVKGIFAQTLR